jgi:hypothetical protein
MPFDPAPIQPKVGEFQEFADAMLRGCAVTTPCTHIMLDGKGGACAIGALYVGVGVYSPRGRLLAVDCHDYRSMGRAYFARYGTRISDDNDSGALTREEIAARIGAL